MSAWRAIKRLLKWFKKLTGVTEIGFDYVRQAKIFCFAQDGRMPSLLLVKGERAFSVGMLKHPLEKSYH
jgi:hypothetical protein